MRRFFAILIVVVVGQLGLWAGVAVADQDTAELRVSPSTVVAGHSVRVSGRCDPNTVGFAISDAFPTSNDFGVGFNTNSTGAFSATATIPRGRTPGTYTVTARCGGGNLGIVVKLKVVAPSRQVPTAVPAGSGGQAASSAPSTRAWQLGVGGGGLVLLGAGIFGLVRRYRRVPR